MTRRQRHSALCTLHFALCTLLCALPAMAALPATAVWEVRTTGSDTQCSGAFNSARGGTDYSQQNTAQATGTVTSSTTTVTATTAIFTSAMVGNTITDGTTVKEITAFTSTTVVTVDSAPSWTAATIYVGGALATPGKALSAAVGGNTLYATGSFTVTSASTNIASGCLALPAGASATAGTRFIGYGSTRGDGTKCTLTASGISTFTMVAGGVNVHVENLTCDGASLTSSRCFNAGTTVSTIFLNCTAKNAKNGAFVAATNSSSYCIGCEATGCATTIPFSGIHCFACVAHDNTTIGFSLSAAGMGVGCISCNNTGASTDGFDIITSVSSMVWGCIAYNNGNHGFFVTPTNNVTMTFVNCIAINNVGKGFVLSGTGDGYWLYNCAVKGNGTDVDSTIPAANRIGLITLTADPFVNASGGDFRLNAVSGGGAALKAASYPPTFPGISTPNQRDIGPNQHVDPPPSGGPIRIGL